MTDYDVKRFALVSAVNAEIEGMKAANKQREFEGYAMDYTDEYFQEKANDLTTLAHAHNEQL